MEKQNDWIFKKTAFAVVPLSAFEYELFSIDREIKKAYLFITDILHITKPKNVGQQVVNLLPGVFLCPFR